MVKKFEFPKFNVSTKKRNTENPAQLTTKNKDRMIWRDKIALWVLGLNTQIGYFVVLTAAPDILQLAVPKEDTHGIQRECSRFTTGIVLLSLTVPALLIQCLQSHFENRFQSLTTLSMLFAIFGYCMLAFSDVSYLALFGIVFISIGYGISDIVLSKQSLLYKIKVGKCYRSGAEEAMIIGPFYYVALRFVTEKVMYIFLSLIFLPLFALLCLLVVLRPPVPPNLDEVEDSEYSIAIFNSRPALSLFEDKLEYVLHLMKYVIPLGIVIFLQGLINQGLYEFIYFRGIFIPISSQYSLYIFCYNVGVYACLATKNLLLTKYVSICAILKLLLTFFFACDAIYFIISQLWLILLLAYIQGLITGVAYTSTMNQILKKEPGTYLDIAETVIKNSIFISSILSAIADFGAHYFISRMLEGSRP